MDSPDSLEEQAFDNLPIALQRALIFEEPSYTALDVAGWLLSGYTPLECLDYISQNSTSQGG